MLNKLIISILTVFFFQIQINNAQIFKDDMCGAKDLDDSQLQKLEWYGNNEFLYKYLDSCGYFNNQNEEKIYYRVPIKFWLYRNNNQTAGITEAQLKQFMQDLNMWNLLNRTGFQYYLRPDFQYINKTRHRELGYILEAPWQTFIHKAEGCINVFIPDELVIKFFGKKSLTGTYNTATKGVIIKSNSSSTGLAHEIGHYFGLEHPHYNWNKRKAKQEAVSRTRQFKGPFKKGLICETNGDALCDTPAEPDLSGYVNSNCEFLGTNLHDKWGDAYQSSTKNIMSYPTHRNCRTVFTTGQVGVMLYTAKKNKYAKRWSTENQTVTKYNSDAYEPDNTKGMATELVPKFKQNHTLHKILMDKHDIDDEDWFRFEINTAITSKAIIELSKGTNQLSEIEISVFDDNNQMIYQKDALLSGTSIKFTVENLKTGTYYAKVKPKTSSNSLTDYNIELIFSK